jgi:hypothetical protein
MNEARNYRVVVLHAQEGYVVSSWGDFYEDGPFVRRVLGYARKRYGDQAVLQRRTAWAEPAWETVADA